MAENQWVTGGNFQVLLRSVWALKKTLLRARNFQPWLTYPPWNWQFAPEGLFSRAMWVLARVSVQLVFGCLDKPNLAPVPVWIIPWMFSTSFDVPGSTKWALLVAEQIVQWHRVTERHIQHIIRRDPWSIYMSTGSSIELQWQWRWLNSWLTYSILLPQQ